MNYPKAKIISKKENKDSIEIYEEKLIPLNKQSIIADGNGAEMARLRTRSNSLLDGFSIKLSPNYDWVIVEDGTEQLVLVPLKKV